MIMCILGIAAIATMQGIETVNNDTSTQALNGQDQIESELETDKALESDSEVKDSLSELEGSEEISGEETIMFCGISTYNPCESDNDCIITGCLNEVCQTKNEEEMETDCIPKDCYDAVKYGYRCACFDSHCKWG
jgi:eight-cysteine-cluster-containing protein